MNISLDYDHTYTEDPFAWDLFIELMQSRGHKVYVVTARKRRDTDDNLDKLATTSNGLYFTKGRAKVEYCDKKGLDIDVWIDDNAFNLLYDKHK